MTSFDSSCLQDLLPLYYKRIFPHNLFCRWLSYGDDDYFSRREFSFTLPGDVYIRFQSFNNQSEFEQALNRKKPEKIDIGAVYNQKPKQRSTTGEFTPVSKELVLDIDLTDYDDVRTCCSGATVCEKCWKFIGIAVQILDAALREDFGFKHLLWVFSGRRGVHCWVCDENARCLDVSGRGAVVEYLSVVRGGENQSKKVKLPGDRIHPSLRRAIDIIDDKFESICLDDQDMFDVDKNLNVLSDDVKKAVLAGAKADRWINLNSYINDKENKKKSHLRHLKKEIQLQFCYPRLDVNVSKGINHLLKAPFCIHPKTGQVCVPFDPKKVFEFKIADVPGITQLIEEIGEHDAEKPQETGIKDWKKTALTSCMGIFEAFVKGMEKQRSLTNKIKKEPSDRMEIDESF